VSDTLLMMSVRQRELVNPERTETVSMRGAVKIHFKVLELCEFCLYQQVTLISNLAQI
jgi:hypothetical protein